MLDQDDIEEAIARIQDLGISRSKAVKALSRYNYDVSRAADYIFSGNALDSESESELEDTPNSEENKEQRDGPNFQTADTKNEASSVNSARGSFNFDNASSSRNTYSRSTSDLNEALKYDPAQWSVVPFSSNDRNLGWDTPVMPSSTSYAEPSVTWWIDPEDPADRSAQNDIPVGLRPPAYSFPYAPIILQTLYHIHAFQHAILSYRPSPDSWGSPMNYWKGNGEQIPPYMSNRNKNISIDVDLLEESMNDIWTERHVQPDAMELEVVPTSARVAFELQKLFGFLSLSKRRYGNVTQLTQMLKSNESGNNWNLQDMTVDAFVDKLVNSLADAEKYADPTKLSIHSTFKDFFLLRALVQDGRDLEVEEIFYLTLGTSRYMRSFHECLGPMVYGGSDVVSSSSVDSDQGSEASDEELGLRLTTFEKIPLILMITLESRAESDDGSGNNSDDRYLVERTIHLGRYLQKNADKALQCYQKVDNLKKQIRQLRNEREKLSCNNNDSGIDTRDILDNTMAYFEGESPKFSQAKDSPNFAETLRSVLSGVKQAISRRCEELQNQEKQYLKEIQEAFDIPEFEEKPYDLRATFHHDGMSGTGHYWAYIRVEPAEENLLMDIPNESGGWYRFCDACVERVTDDQMLQDDTPPFALVYTDRDIPAFSREQLQSAIPETLKDFVNRDNEDFQREIDAYAENPTFPKEPDASFANDDVSINFEGNDSSETLDGEYEYDAKRYEYNTGASGNLDELVNLKIEEAQKLEGDDSRLLQSFDLFLAKIKDRASLQRLYVFYITNRSFDTLRINEQEARKDEKLKRAWAEYDTFCRLALTAANALILFTNGDYLQSLLSFANLKQSEAGWKEQLKVDTKFAELDRVGFQSLVTRYGRLCIKLSNERAYTKAINPAYQTRGLEDALRISQLVHVIIGPENLADDALYSELRDKWLSFSESQGSSLEETQAELLNNLMISYLEGQTGGPGRSDEENAGALCPIGKDESIDSFYETARLSAHQHEITLADECNNVTKSQ